MTEGCEHWLVQRRVNDRYWACVDCEWEFRPVESGGPNTGNVGKSFPALHSEPLRRRASRVE